MAENSKVDLPRSRLGDLDCTVCSQLLYDPVTISCGHSYCSRCLRKALHYQPACPSCRVPCYFSGRLPVNIVLRSVLEEALPVETADRRKETEADEAAALDATTRIPLFVISAVVFPGGTTRFFIFEVRYKLMLARVMASSRRFGLVCPRRHPEDGSIGRCRVGTVLEITKCHQLPDGRAMIEVCGCERFSIVDSELRDGYYVATTQKLEDHEDEEAVSVDAASEPSREEEEATSNRMVTRRPGESVDAYIRRFMASITDSDQSDRLTTHLRSALRELGPPPPVEEGRSRLGMWLAEHLIFDEERRQALLEMTSPEERLTAIASHLRDNALLNEAPAGACCIC